MYRLHSLVLHTWRRQLNVVGECHSWPSCSRRPGIEVLSRSVPWTPVWRSWTRHGIDTYVHCAGIDLELQNRGFSDFCRSEAATHIWRVNCTKSLEIDQDNLRMKFSALNVLTPRFKESSVPAHQIRVHPSKRANYVTVVNGRNKNSGATCKVKADSVDSQHCCWTRCRWWTWHCYETTPGQ